MRETVIPDRPFVLFLIGMRVNQPWRVGQWWPVFRAMPRMLKELRDQPDLGLLGMETWFGRTTLMVQYWRDHESLQAYATGRDREHLPAWRDFNRRISGNGAVGIWHETYMVEPGRFEGIYGDMPPFGLGKVLPRLEATGEIAQAPGRLAASLAAAAGARSA